MRNKAEKIAQQQEQQRTAAIREMNTPILQDSIRPLIGKTELAHAVLGLVTGINPMPIWSAYRDHPGMHFPVLANTTGRTYLVGPIERENTSTAKVEPSHLPTLKDIGNSLSESDKHIDDHLQKLPGSRRLLQVAKDAPVFLKSPYRPPDDEAKQETSASLIRSSSPPAPTVTAAPGSTPVTTSIAKSSSPTNQAYASIDKAAMLSGINAYQHWPTNVPQDERLKGIAFQRHNDHISNVYQLLDAFAPLMPRTWGNKVSVDQYEYAMLKYAMQSHRFSADGGGARIDPAEPQPAKQQAELQNDVAKLFFSALVQINGSSSAQSLEDFVHDHVSAELDTNPTLDKLSKFAVRTKATVLQRLALPALSLSGADRNRFNTLTRWFAEAVLIDIDPLFSTRLNIEHADFRHTPYHSHDSTLMSIGAGFINQFPAKTSQVLTPAVLREAGLHSVIDMSPSAWPSATGQALMRSYNWQTKNISGERLGTPSERIKFALATLIAPDIPKIRLMQEVEINEEEFLLSVNDRFNGDALHKLQSKNALNKLKLSKYNLYNYGLEHLPLWDRENLIASGNAAQLEVFVPKVILYEAKHADVSYKAVFNATSGLIIRTGSINNDAPSDYYLFSEERSWGSPVVSKITEQIHQAGSVNKYVNENHASFTSGVRFHPSNHTTFEATSTFIHAENFDKIARVVSGLQSFSPTIHERFTDASPSQPLSPTLTEEIFHSEIYALGKFIIGMIPGGNCVIAIMDTAEMIALPAKTEDGKAEQGLAVEMDALFCFTGLVKADQARYLIPSVRTPFNYRSPNEFAASKATEHLSKQPPEISPKAGLPIEHTKLCVFWST
ncbi:hypothetical protein QN379_23175 [Glaciimonas sp. Gout2]|uniref:hypothetical protein n=1 Tax=unclassified Glaciimonas TaxID=2644401 RepID=UPI002B22E69B|nr:MULTISPECIES: hypothetical protein [unclassified Glaciimonas]MEB0013919.1 hypothetical protein [Glaciimonas sp. Cout2]MEB0084913.1 hypothetical protein [Glaciimonas sp. Gout2]